MATRADMMLMQALSQFGAGLGGYLGQRRQNKQNAALADQMFPSDATAQGMVRPGSMELAQAIGGAIPNVAGMPGLGGISGMAMQGAVAQKAQDAASQANAQAAQMRELMKDPQAAAMIKQQHIASMMPKETKFIPLGNGSYATGSGNSWDVIKGASKPFELKPGHTYRFPKADGTFEDRTIPADTKKGTLSQIHYPIQERAPNGQQLHEYAILNNVTGKREVIGKGLPGQSNQKIENDDMTKMPKPMQGTVQSVLMDTQQSLRNFQNMDQTFQEKYLEVPYKGWNELRSVIIKAGGKGVLSDAQVKEHGEAAVFYQDTWRTVNEYIRAITGAQMNKSEVPRLMKSIANTTDDSVEYQAKLRRSIETASQVDAEMRAYLKEKKILDTRVFNEELREWGDQYTNGDTAARTAIENVAREKAAQAWAMEQISFRWGVAGYTADEASDDGLLDGMSMGG